MFRHPSHKFSAYLFGNITRFGQPCCPRKDHGHDITHKSPDRILGIQPMARHDLMHRQRDHRLNLTTTCVPTLKRITQPNRGANYIAHFFKIPRSLTRPPPTRLMIVSGDPDVFRLTTDFDDFGLRVGFGFFMVDLHG